VVAAKQAAGRRPRLRWRPLASAAGLALILFPLAPLANYYRDAVADGRTNQPLYRLLDSIVAARQSDEPVLLDEGLAQEQLGAGGTDLKAFRMLLGTSSIPAEVAKVSDTDDGQLADGPSVLFLMEAKKRTSLPRSVRSIQLSPEVPSASGSGHRYAVYRLATR
jgi:hypothetical protein